MPLPPGLGYKSSILLGKETTYGVAATAADAHLELLGFSLNKNPSVIEDPSMTATQLSRRFIGQGGSFVSGSFSVRLNYEEHEHLWRLLLGTITKTGASPPYNYEMLESSDATLRSATLDVSWGNVPTGKVNRFIGVFLTGFRLSGTAGGGDSAMLRVECDFVAKSLTPNTTPMTTTGFAEPHGILYHQMQVGAAEFKDGSGGTPTDIMLKSFNLSVTVPHDTERFYFSSVNADFPVRNGPLDATIELEEEWNGTTLIDAISAGSVTALRFLFDDGGGRTLDINAGAPTTSLYSSDITGFGSIIQRAGYRLAYASGDSSFLKVVTEHDISVLGL